MWKNAKKIEEYIKNQLMPHIKDSDMEELGEPVLGKLQSMTDEEFAEISLEAAEDM